MSKFWVALLCLMIGTWSAYAGTGSATLTVTGTVESSITVTFVETTVPGTTGLGTADVSIDFGHISAISGQNLVREPSQWTVSGGPEIFVSKANLTSPYYSLSARLQNPPAAGTTWKIFSGVVVSDTADTWIDFFSYDNPDPIAIQLVISDAAPPGPIDNVVILTATPE